MRNDRLIVALDLDDLDEVKRIVESLGSEIGVYKVGQQLVTSVGPSAIAYLKSLDKEVFLDLKLHEIPNSVASAVRAAGRHGANLVTVHASGGSEMLSAAVEAASEFERLRILALTVVTSLSDRDLRDIGFPEDGPTLAVRLARLAKASGCHGLIAFPVETRDLRESIGDDVLIVTAGTRPTGSTSNDQHRIGTPGNAISSGATHCIVGRPIVQSGNPLSVARSINAEINAAS